MRFSCFCLLSAENCQFQCLLTNAKKVISFFLFLFLWKQSDDFFSHIFDPLARPKCYCCFEFDWIIRIFAVVCCIYFRSKIKKNQFELIFRLTLLYFRILFIHLLINWIKWKNSCLLVTNSAMSWNSVLIIYILLAYMEEALFLSQNSVS